MVQLKFSNRLGIPNLEAGSVTSDGTNTTVNFPAYSIINGSFYGGFWVKIPQEVTTSTEPLQFSTLGITNSTIPVYLANSAQATVANIASSGPAIYLVFYDRDNKRVQFI